MPSQLLMTLERAWRERRFGRRLARARRRPSAEAITPLAIRLIALGRLEDAEALVELGLRHAPDSPDLVEQLAFCAHNAGRYREALSRWRRLGALRPDRPMGWCGIASNARELRLFGEAAAAIEEALRRFPDDPAVLGEAARVRESCGAPAEAADLWRRLLSHPSAEAHWHLALARNLLKLQRYDEAEAVVRPLAEGDQGSVAHGRAMARLWGRIAREAAGSNLASLVLYAAAAVPRFGDDAYAVKEVAETATDLDAAGAALRRLLERDPADPEARESYVRVLLRSDRVDEAERQIESGMRLARDHDGLRSLRGLVAIRRNGWDAAYAIASAEAAEHPDDPTAAYVLDRVRRVRQLEAAEQAGDAARALPIAPPLCDEPETRQLLLAFESIGRDCEFGIVQRRYGAEPLGLLRWADTDIRSLLAALAARFEGVGEPDNTELMVGSVGEIQVRDKRWNLAMHTFLYETEVSLADLHPKMCRRMAYLRDKLLRELGTGEKTLVFKSDIASADEIAALHEALLAFGPNRLLNARHASGTGGFAPGEPGSVREIRPGLFIGHLSRLSVLTDLAYDDWVAICQGVESWPARTSGLVPDETASSKHHFAKVAVQS